MGARWQQYISVYEKKQIDTSRKRGSASIGKYFCIQQDHKKQKTVRSRGLFSNTWWSPDRCSIFSCPNSQYNLISKIWPYTSDYQRVWRYNWSYRNQAPKSVFCVHYNEGCWAWSWYHQQKRPTHGLSSKNSSLFTLVTTFGWKYADILAKGQFYNATDTIFWTSENSGYQI